MNRYIIYGIGKVPFISKVHFTSETNENMHSHYFTELNFFQTNSQVLEASRKENSGIYHNSNETIMVRMN